MSAFLARDPEMRGDRRMTMSAAATLTQALQYGRRQASMNALARELGVSRRTLYRWRGATFHTVVVEGWKATFVIRPHHTETAGCPIQITPWQQVES